LKWKRAQLSAANQGRIARSREEVERFVSQADTQDIHGVGSLTVAPLFDGPIDVVGDVHGEIEPLWELVERLGYDVQGRHPKGRRLVFVGDLGDRGPDSPAVIELVRGLVEQGLAQCVLGNHELNLLRGESKQGNRWFIDPSHPEQQPGGEFEHCKVAPEKLKPVWLEFLASLPLALERTDLRVVHAAWVPREVAALRRASGSTIEVYRAFEARTQEQLAMEELRLEAAREEAAWGDQLEVRTAKVPLLRAIGELDERYQMGNPVRVATSGVERLARAPFWSSGKWRMCDRVQWWEEYRENVPVIIGHYWRQVKLVKNSPHAASKPEVFVPVGPTVWVGLKGNVFCVDFSVGARYQERKAGVKRFETHLAAVRWPEKEVWFERGKVGEG